MNDLNAVFLKTQSMPDVQSTRDERALAIEQVGIRGVRHPLTVRSKAGSFPSVATFEMNVAFTCTYQRYAYVTLHCTLAKARGSSG